MASSYNITLSHCLIDSSSPLLNDSLPPVYFYRTTNAQIVQTTFQNNIKDDQLPGSTASALALVSVTNAYLSACVFINNTLKSSLYIKDHSGYLAIEGVQFINNSARMLGGGALMIDASAITAQLTNCSFSTNSAVDGGNGGGLYVASNITITNCTFQNNRVSQGSPSALGGAIYLLGGTLVSRSSIYTSNKAGISSFPSRHPPLTHIYNAAIGGAIYMDKNTFLDEQLSSFTLNSAQDGGL